MKAPAPLTLCRTDDAGNVLARTPVTPELLAQARAAHARGDATVPVDARSVTAAAGVQIPGADRPCSCCGEAPVIDFSITPLHPLLVAPERN